MSRTRIQVASALVILVAASWANADIVNWTIQSPSSQLTFSGGLFSNGSFEADFVSQSPGNGLTTSFSGNIASNLTSSSIELVNASLIANVSGDWAPTEIVPLSPGPANYGFQGTWRFWTAVFAIRDLSFDLSSDGMDLTGLFMGGSTQTFQGDLTSEISTGTLFSIVLDNPNNSTFPATMTGLGDQFLSSGSIAYSADSTTATLTLPVDMALTQGVYRYFFNGQIVATASVPEVNVCLQLGLASSILGLWVYRSRR